MYVVSMGTKKTVYEFKSPMGIKMPMPPDNQLDAQFIGPTRTCREIRHFYWVQI